MFPVFFAISACSFISERDTTNLTSENSTSPPPSVQEKNENITPKTPGKFSIASPNVTVLTLTPTITWTASERATSYSAFVGIGNSCKIKLVVKTEDESSTTIKLNAVLTDNETYTVCVIAHNEFGDLEASNSDKFSFTVHLPAIPDPDHTLICNSGNSETACFINSLQIIPNGKTVVIPGNLIVQNNGNIGTNPVDTVRLVVLGNLVIENGGKLTGNFALLSAKNLTVSSLGKIVSDSMGFPGGISYNVSLTLPEGAILSNGQGPGGGIHQVAPFGHSGSGGGHGGVGGGAKGYFQYFGSKYGNMTEPTMLGSGGSGARYINEHGGNGGGAIKIVVTENLTLNGVVSANGEKPSYNSCAGPGGGSGGSIWITAGQITGTGIISARGGDGGHGHCYGGVSGGGGGGGGRISLTSGNKFTNGTITVAGGNVDTEKAHPGKLGTYYMNIPNICDQGSLDTNCIITSPVSLSADKILVALGDLIVESTGSIISADTSTPQTNGINLSISGSLVVKANGLIESEFEQIAASQIDIGGRLIGNFKRIVVDNLHLNAGGEISADGLGASGGTILTSGQGVGSGQSSKAASGGSASHGGYGGAGSNSGNAGGIIYGSALNPTTKGSGGAGGGYRDEFGGAGGGAIKIEATGNILIDGKISANGLPGTVDYTAGGSGSGGSIWIKAFSLSGTGIIQANGATGLPSPSTPQNGGGGGGGGRIAVETTSPSTLPTLQAAGGQRAGTEAAAGSNGTVCLNTLGIGCQ